MAPVNAQHQWIPEFFLATIVALGFPVNFLPFIPRKRGLCKERAIEAGVGWGMGNGWWAIKIQKNSPMTLEFHWKTSREGRLRLDTGLLRGQVVWFWQFLRWEWFSLCLAWRGDGCSHNYTAEEITWIWHYRKVILKYGGLEFFYY